jgi:hypothetical protein
MWCNIRYNISTRFFAGLLSTVIQKVFHQCLHSLEGGSVAYPTFTNVETYLVELHICYTSKFHKPQDTLWWLLCICHCHRLPINHTMNIFNEHYTTNLQVSSTHPTDGHHTSCCLFLFLPIWFPLYVSVLILRGRGTFPLNKIIWTNNIKWCNFI